MKSSVHQNEWNAPDSVDVMRLHVRIFKEADDPEEAAKVQDAEWMQRGLPRACFQKSGTVMKKMWVSSHPVKKMNQRK